MIPEVGQTMMMTWVVKSEHLASAFGSGLADVLATPVLVGFCEECARSMIDPYLEPGRQTVGTAVHLDHMAATPLGMTVTIEATLVEIDRRRRRFEIEAKDEIETIARCVHERFVIDAAAFAERVQEKAKRAAA